MNIETINKKYKKYGVVVKELETFKYTDANTYVIVIKTLKANIVLTHNGLDTINERIKKELKERGIV